MGLQGPGPGKEGAAHLVVGPGSSPRRARVVCACVCNACAHTCVCIHACACAPRREGGAHTAPGGGPCAPAASERSRALRAQEVGPWAGGEGGEGREEGGGRRRCSYLTGARAALKDAGPLRAGRPAGRAGPPGAEGRPPAAQRQAPAAAAACRRSAPAARAPCRGPCSAGCRCCSRGCCRRRPRRSSRRSR